MISSSITLLLSYPLSCCSRAAAPDPGRGQSPVECGEIPSVRLSVDLSIFLFQNAGLETFVSITKGAECQSEKSEPEC